MFKKNRISALVLFLGACALTALTVGACTDNTVDMPQASHGAVTDAATDTQSSEAGADASNDTGVDAVVVDSAHDAPSDAGDAGDG